MSIYKKIKKFANEIGEEKLDQKKRIDINKELWNSGLDGNGRFERPESGYVVALEILARHGIELDDHIDSLLYFSKDLDSKTFNVNVALSNEEDPYSPSHINNSFLHISWAKLREGVYETIAYMS